MVITKVIKCVKFTAHAMSCSPVIRDIKNWDLDISSVYWVAVQLFMHQEIRR